MGLTAPLVGIHGTPDAASIGYSASHGCIRMYIPDADWLFERVDLGTPVLILAA
jgi:lipoprotein-anchoring transpeptidase ErfK/SrfK